MENAAHWCKAAIEEAVKPTKSGTTLFTPSVPVEPVSGISPTNSNLSYPVNQGMYSSYMAANSPYMLFYQQFYNQSNSASASSDTSTKPASAPAPSFSYPNTSSNMVGYNMLPYTSSAYGQYPPNQQIYPPFQPSGMSLTSYKDILQQNQSVSSYNYPATAISTQTSSGIQAQHISPTSKQPTATSSSKKPNPNRFANGSQEDPTQEVTTESKPVTKPKSQQQPATLQDFVRRSFATCVNDAQRKFIEDELQKLIGKVTSEGRTNVHRWDLEPSPRFPPELLNEPSTAVITSRNLKPLINTHSNTDFHDNKLLNNHTPSNQSVEGKKRKSRWESDTNTILTLNHQAVASSQSKLSNKSTNNSFTFQDVSMNQPVQNAKLKKNKKEKTIAGEQPQPQNQIKSSISIDIEDPIKLEAMKKLKEKNAARFQVKDQEVVVPVVDLKPMVTVGNGKKKKGGQSKVIVTPSELTQTDEIDMETLKIVGTSEKLEKDYLRLTSAPAPSNVRPEAVLRKAIKQLKKKWADDEVDYLYMCSQLKAIRQDLTVQHIQNDFTVHVYEMHARVALESDDLNEYNQCQTQLKQLYHQGLRGCEAEFVAYRILYYVYLLGNKKYKAGSSDLAFVMSSLKDSDRRDPAVIHALEIRRVIQLDNYYRYFQLYKETPNMGNCILDHSLDNCRIQALQRICKSHRPLVPVDYVVKQIGFEDVQLGIDFIKRVGCKLVRSTVESDQVTVSSISSGWDVNTKDTVLDPSLVITVEKSLLL